MKKTILTTLIAAGINTAPLVNELAKLSFATDDSAQAPVQELRIQKKVTAKPSAKTPSQTMQELDTIPELIFDNGSLNQLAVLTPEEMAETEGAIWPVIAAFTLAGAAIGGWKTHIDSIEETGYYADYPDLTKGMAEGAVIGASIPVPASRAMAVTGTPAHWVRLHNSYSRAGQFSTYSLTWGSNAHYRSQIGSKYLRDLNEKLRNTQLPGNGWRTQDAGHFHIFKR